MTDKKPCVCKGNLTRAATRVDPEDVALSEIRQALKDGYRVIPLT